MSGFDSGRVYSAQVLAGSEASRAPDAPAQTEQNLFEFVQRFRQGNDYLYRDRLRANLLAKLNVLEVAVEHVALWNPTLAQSLTETPGEILPLVSQRTVGDAEVGEQQSAIVAEPRPSRRFRTVSSRKQ